MARLIVALRYAGVAVAYFSVGVASWLNLVAADEPALNGPPAGVNPHRWTVNFPDSIKKRFDDLDQSRDRFLAKGDLKQAAGAQTKILSLLQRNLGKDHIRTLDAKQRLRDDRSAARLRGSVKNKYLAAIRTAQEAQRIIDETGRPPKDLTDLDRARATIGGALGTRSRAYVLSCLVCGYAQASAGDFESARKALGTGRSIAKLIGLEKHPIYAGLSVHLGWAEMNGGNLKDARRLLLESRDLVASLYGRKHWVYLVNTCHLTLWYLENGSDQDAQKAADEAYQLATHAGWKASLPKVASKRCMRLRSVLIVFAGIKGYDKALVASTHLLKELKKPEIKISPHSLADYYVTHALLLTKLGRKKAAQKATQTAKSLRGQVL